jgi:predicted dehydrogenase/threonine dehydrogenase-like Zn-dependent dehydrogenase
MKQIILPFNTGKPELTEVPAPMVQPGEVLIQTTVSVVSSGTERMLMDFGQAGWLGKLTQQPEKARQVIDKLRTDGLIPTVKAVRSKLDAPIPLGYSSAGIVLAVGSGIQDMKAGDRVASNGAHAEIVSVPRNLVAKIPEGVPYEAAAFTILGAIALQGIRLAAPTFGETVAVIGLGLIGQLTAQLLIANGCRVIGTDLQAHRLKLAADKGVVALSQPSGDAVRAMTDGHGADAVIVTASATNDSILTMAADMARKRGRVILTGVVDMKLSRDLFFKKELSFQVSSSYGPGRYERDYEQKGLDYPIGYVRWTEGRNFEAVLTAMQRHQLDVTPLISARIPFSNASRAYEQLDSPEHLASLFTYPTVVDARTNVIVENTKPSVATASGITVIGAGNFAGSILLPTLKKQGAQINCVISKNGLSASILAKKFNIPKAGTNYEHLLNDKATGAVVIATPHHTHASIAASALRAGKHVLVEKPLALTRSQLEDVSAAVSSSAARLTIGFNRRFAPLALAAKELMGGLGGPMNVILTVNAGTLPKGHWLLDKDIGGGRLLGEACHFIDLCRFMVGASIIAVCANSIAETEAPSQNASILLRFADGSNAVVNYFSNGSKGYHKERLELYRSNQTIVIENWKSLRSYGFRKDINKRGTQDKGHSTLIASWLKSLKGGPPPIPVDEILNSSLATLGVEESIQANGWISL